MADTRATQATCLFAEQCSGTGVCAGVFQQRNKCDDNRMNPVETATLQLGECFWNGHFAPKTGGNGGAGAPNTGSRRQEVLDGCEGLRLSLGPIAANNLKCLLVLFQPVSGGVEKRQALVQMGLAALAIVSPVDVFGGQ